MKVCLALGGGGARGYAHIGVLKGLFEMGIRDFHAISGTSAGGLIAGLFAIYGDPYKIHKVLKDFTTSPIYQELGFSEKYKEKDTLRRLYSNIREKVLIAKSFIANAFLNEEERDRIFGYLYKEDKFIEHLFPRLRIMAVDIVQGRDIAFRGGSLHIAMKATSALPGALPPVKFGDMLLVDGGITHNLPIIPLLLDDCDVIIAVDVSRRLKKKKHFNNLPELLLRCEYITLARLTEFQSQFADVIIHPDVEDVEWFEFDRLDEVVERGYKVFKQQEEKIKEVMGFFYQAKKKLLFQRELAERLSRSILYFP